MLTSLSDHIRMVVYAKEGGIDIIRVIFFFKADSIETFRLKKKQPLSDDYGNFQWQACWIHFSREDSEGNLKYYIYRLELTPEGYKSDDHSVYDSNQNMDSSEIKKTQKGESEPAKDILPTDIENSTAYKNIFGSPSSQSILNFDFKKPEADFINSQENKTYTRKQFEDDYENNKEEKTGKYYYILFSKEKKKKLSPFGKFRQFTTEEKTPEKKETPAEEEKFSFEDIYRTAVKIAKDKKPEIGGFDIMKKLVDKLRTIKQKPNKKDYYTNGWGIVRKWQQEQQHKSTKNKPRSDGFDIMQQTVKNPEPIKKESLMEPLEKDPPKKTDTKRKFQ